MKTVVDPKTTWWWRREAQTRLSKWTAALLQGRQYNVRIENEGTGYTDFENKLIQVNAQLFPRSCVEVQFRITQAVLAHEVGHVLFTHGWKGKNSIQKQLVNMLEDERIERCMSVLYPGIVPVINLLGDRMLGRQENLSFVSSERQAFVCCLVWRWAKKRWAHASFGSRLMLTAKGLELWEAVRPLAEQAWEARSTTEVEALAHKILEILGLSDEDEPVFIQEDIWLDDLPGWKPGSPEPLCFPAGPAADLPGLGHSPTLDAFHEDNYSKPAPYIKLQEKVGPIAKALAQSLKFPEPYTRLAPHEWRGRYSFRQELRTPTAPNLVALDSDLSARSLALYLLTDRSGSMDSCNEPVREALMTLYLAATTLEIPTGLAFFGSDNYVDVASFVFSPVPMCDKPCEDTLGMIAGFSGTTGAEFLAWGLERAEQELAARPETKKVVLVIHDGQPVYDGPLGIDRRMSEERVARMTANGWMVVGVYLGRDDDERQKLARIFPRMISTTPSDLPEKLGRILRSMG